MEINYRSLLVILLGLILIVGVINLTLTIFDDDEDEQVNNLYGDDGDSGPPNNMDATSNEAYNPTIIPSDFTSKVTNKYFNLTPGKKMVYEGETEDGTERIEFYVMSETRMVQGVETAIVWDRVWLDGELIEETFDWYAQDIGGNVWYFGEDSKEIENGKVISTEGSWETGIDGAKPGIIMKADPAIGDSYRQEYYKGEAEDMADVLAFGESVTVAFGTFSDCLKTLDWTPLEPDLKEHKYYSAKTGGVVLEASVDGKERVELIDLQYDSQPTP